MQLQGEAACGGARRPGALATARHILRAEGTRALYAGLAPAVARHLPYTSVRVAVFEQLRALAAGHTRPGEPPPLAATLACGLAAGALGQAAAVPADLVKVGPHPQGRPSAPPHLPRPAAPRGCLVR